MIILPFVHKLDIMVEFKKPLNLTIPTHLLVTETKPNCLHVAFVHTICKSSDSLVIIMLTEKIFPTYFLNTRTNACEGV